ncbi:CBS domain-containing protein [Candidatus Gottesmanbacteria bacterium]|nr:CBS domain-containing protein [Candidatus Gottesmanbacteria bacterium]
MKVGDVMSRKLITVNSDDTLRQLWKILFKSHINALPVVDKKQKLLGIITKDDILKLIYPDYEDLIEDFFSITDFEEMEKRIIALGKKKSTDIMCKRVIYCREDLPIMRALSRMIVRNFNQLPVLSDTDKVVGMVTKGDIFYALFRSQLKGNTLSLKK